MALASKSDGPEEELSELEYLYRDAANFKFRARVILRGAFSILDLQPYLYEGEFFLPMLVALSDLAPNATTSDDHPWHEIGGVQRVSSGESLTRASELVARFKLQDGLAWGQWSPAIGNAAKSSLELGTRRRRL